MPRTDVGELALVGPALDNNEARRHLLAGLVFSGGTRYPTTEPRFYALWSTSEKAAGH